MSRSTNFLCLFVALMSLSCSSYGYNFMVGGKDGWVLNPSESYTSWSGRNRFSVNDTLVFKGSDSVLVVTKENFDSCNTSSPIQSLAAGSATYKIEKSGPIYFISGNQDSCSKGQKLAIIVLSVRGSPPSPQAPPPVAQTPPPGASMAPAPGGASMAPAPGGASMAPAPGGASIAPAPGGASMAPGPSGESLAPGPGGESLAPGPGGESLAPGPGGESLAPIPDGSSGSGGVLAPGPTDGSNGTPPKSTSPVSITSSLVLVSGISLIVSVVLGSCA